MSYERYLENLIMEFIPKHFTEEQLEKYGIMDRPLTGPHGLRKELGELDIEFFGRAYFPPYYENNVPDFHKSSYAEMQRIQNKGGGSKYIEAAPRGSAKSVRWSFLFPTHCALYGIKHYIVIISDSSSQAEGQLASIKEECESNSAIIEDWGYLQGTPWNNDAALLKGLDCLIVAKGSGKKIRGIKHKHYRPDLIILDDIENDEQVQSPEQRRKLLDWFDKAVSKAGTPKTDIVVVGTVLHYASLLSTLLARPGYKSKKYRGVIKGSSSPYWDDWEKLYVSLELGEDERKDEAYEFFKQHEAEMMMGVEVIWPERVTYYDYRVMIIDEGMAAYNSEVQNEPVNPEDCPITEEDFQFYDRLPDFTELIIKGACDPSMGKTKKSDKSVINAVARDKHGYLYVIFSDGQRRHPDIIINDLMNYANEYDYQEFGMETIQFQEYFAHNVRKAAALKGVFLPITELKPHTDKELRIMKLMPMIKNGYIKFARNQKDLINELIYLGKWKTDDEADCLEMAVSLFIGEEIPGQHTLLPGLSGVSMTW